MKESGDIILSGAKIYAELGEALARKVPSRTNETTIFKSLGMAVEESQRRCWFIDQRQQLNTDTDNLVSQVLATSNCLPLSSRIKTVAAVISRT